MKPLGLPFIENSLVDISSCLTSKSAIIKSNLNWTVDKSPACFEFQDKKGNEYLSYLENGYIIHRNDNGLALGFAKSRYEVIQNTEAFSFFDDIISKEKAVWQCAGTFDGGKNIFITAKLPFTFLVGDIDPIETYITFINSHEGGVGIKVIITPVRYTSKTILHIPDEINFTKKSIIHNTVKDDSVKFAKSIINDIRELSNLIKHYYNKLYNENVNTTEAYHIIASFILSEEEYDSLKVSKFTILDLYNKNTEAFANVSISKQRAAELRKVIDYYHTGIKQLEFQGTKWGVYTAISGYYSNIYTNRMSDDSRMKALLYGTINRKCNKLLNSLLK